MSWSSARPRRSKAVRFAAARPCHEPREFFDLTLDLLKAFVCHLDEVIPESWSSRVAKSCAAGGTLGNAQSIGNPALIRAGSSTKIQYSCLVTGTRKSPHIRINKAQVAGADSSLRFRNRTIKTVNPAKIGTAMQPPSSCSNNSITAS